MAERKWSGMVPKDRLDVLHQLQRILKNFGVVQTFGITTNGHSVERNRFLFRYWDGNMTVEIFSNAFFHDYNKSDISMIVEYEPAEGLSLSKALGELLKPPTADILFLWIDGID
ncbi:hypothetical protein MKX03_015743, partial [Papaver bracteatum]